MSPSLFIRKKSLTEGAISRSAEKRLLTAISPNFLRFPEGERHLLTVFTVLAIHKEIPFIMSRFDQELYRELKRSFVSIMKKNKRIAVSVFVRWKVDEILASLSEKLLDSDGLEQN